MCLAWFVHAFLLAAALAYAAQPESTAGVAFEERASLNEHAVRPPRPPAGSDAPVDSGTSALAPPTGMEGSPRFKPPTVDSDHLQPPRTSMTEPEEGDLRLVNQININGYVTGALQLFQDGAFGSVCNVGFHDLEAQVACRQLGFSGGGHLQAARFSVGLTAEARQELAPPLVSLEDPDCAGTETRLVDCPDAEIDPYMEYGYNNEYGTYAYFSSTCDGDNVQTFIACGTETEAAVGYVRLAAGATSEDGMSQTGRLEVFNEGGWGTVCARPDFSRRFLKADAQVACRSLGFSDGVVAAEAGYGELLTRLPIWMSGGMCVGSEASLMECPETTVGSAGICRPSDIIELMCR